jgi:hypothetical protein
MLRQCRNDIFLQDSAAAVPSQAALEAVEAAPAQATLKVNTKIIIVCGCHVRLRNDLACMQT